MVTEMWGVKLTIASRCTAISTTLGPNICQIIGNMESISESKIIQNLNFGWDRRSETHSRFEIFLPGADSLTAVNLT